MHHRKAKRRNAQNYRTAIAASITLVLSVCVHWQRQLLDWTVKPTQKKMQKKIKQQQRTKVKQWICVNIKSEI